MIGFEQLPVEVGEFLEKPFELLVAVGHFADFADHGGADVFGPGFSLFLSRKRMSAPWTLGGHRPDHKVQIGGDLTFKTLLLLL